jgi:hypothetical protein
MPVALASIRDLLKPGLYAVDGKYDMIPAQWSQVFTTRKSTMAVERKVQNRFLGLAALKGEGGQTAFDNNAGERYVYNAESFEVGLGYAITRKAIDDNLYKSEFNPTNLQLLDSFSQFKEIQSANIFNNGTTYSTNIGGDGVAFFSTAHPVDGTTIANRFSVDLDLNESSLLQGMINVRSQFLNEAGLKIYARAEKLLVPVAQEPVAIRLTKTELRPGTANNDVNAILSTSGGLPKGYMVWDYLTSNSAWFLTTNYAKDALLMMQRIKFETDMQVDFVTDNLLVKGYERYTPTYNDWRAAYGSFPSS